MTMLVENTGSAARDFCMLERNLLAALKLACVLCLLFASVLLRGRLAIDAAPGGGDRDTGRGDAPAAALASVHFVAALAVLAGAAHEYHAGVRDLRGARAFFRSDRLRLGLMAGVSGVVVGTCVLLLAVPDIV